MTKCEFFEEELVYLGFMVSKDRLCMDPKKVKAILEWPMPHDVTKVRSFNGITIFYNKFIRGFNGIFTSMKKV
jgi:hypothetical protein